MITAIVILNWNGADMLRRFLPSVVEHTGTREADIIVADNGSTDESLSILRKEFPEVRIVALPRNYGFAEGYNQALRRLPRAYDFYLLLNSDVRVTEGWLRPMLDYMNEHADVAACQPKLLAEHTPSDFEYAGAAGGYIDSLGYPFCRGRLFDTVETDSGQYDSVADIFWATGAALLIRSEAYWEVGGLDGTFFAHQEEIDLCWRLRSRGYRIVCIPQSTIYHLGGGTLPKANPRKTYLNFRNNLLLLYKNLPDEVLSRTLHIRCLLDWTAAAVFLLKGQWKSFWAVLRARRDFRRLRHNYKEAREQNLAETRVDTIREILPGSLLWQYYIKRRKHFPQLVWE